MGRREIELRLTVDELLADLADHHPMVALAQQQRAQALFADAVGGGGIDQVDAEIPRQIEQVTRLCIVGNAKAAGVLHALITAQLDRAQSQWRYIQAGAA